MTRHGQIKRDYGATDGLSAVVAVDLEASAQYADRLIDQYRDEQVAFNGSAACNGTRLKSASR